MTWTELEEEWLGPGNVLHCHTSGSTGTPKAIELPKLQVAASAGRTVSFFGLGPDSHLHSCLAPDYIGGKMMMIRAMICGGGFTWEKPSNRPLADGKEKRIDLLCVVPSQLLHIVHNTTHLPEIKNILVGGSPVSGTLRKEVAASGLAVWETYGMTETASHIAIRRVTDPQGPFRPLPGIAVSAPAGTLEIEIAGWQRFVTNDIAEIESDGSFQILGRADNVIITGGLKVHPESVERKLGALLPFPVMLTSEPDEKWGERTVLLVENPTMTIDEIMAKCRSLLAAHEIPKEIRIAAIPRTANGKIRRK